MPYDYHLGRYVHAFPSFQGKGRDILLNEHSTLDIERNLQTFATSRSGKGVCQIIFNLLMWKHNALVIDPKGEAAEAACEVREYYDQDVYVLDPFRTCNVPDRYRAKLNLLDEIDPSSPHAFRQLNAIADGLVMRHSAEAGFWDGGTLEVLAGFAAHVLSSPEIGARNLAAVRDLLTEPDPEKFAVIVDTMATNSACGRLPITAAGKLTKTGTEAGHFLSGAVSNTKWLDDPFMVEMLSESTFKLSDLKRKPMTVFLVLPMDALADYGRFLRLFVRMALFHMMQKMPSGALKGERCLFILDEAYSLGHIAEIQKAVGGLPGFNLHLWPFWQDLNQLREVYGRDGAGTFFANADASFFFGVNDPETAEYVSKVAGVVNESDLSVKPPVKPQDPVPQRFMNGFFGSVFCVETPEYQRWKIAHVQPVEGKDDGFFVSHQDNMAAYLAARAVWERQQGYAEAEYQNAMNIYAHARASVGRARLSISDVMEITARNEKRKVSDFALMLKGGICYKIPLDAYFEDRKCLADIQHVRKWAEKKAKPKKKKSPKKSESEIVDSMIELAISKQGKDV